MGEQVSLLGGTQVAREHARMSMDGRKLFFLHVMKTGGATLLSHILRNYERSAIYPYKSEDADIYRANYSLDYLTRLAPERRDRIQIYTGHFPFVAVDLLAEPLTTIAILRDPIERTLSYLRHCRLHHEQHRGMALEEIYEDPIYFPCFIHNHQTKLFALAEADNPESYMDVLEVDQRRLEQAKGNLERIDVLGVQGRFDELLAQLRNRLGWRIDKIPSRRVNPGEPVAASFRKRIAEDNAIDVDFYRYALELCERRHGARALA